MSAGAVIGTVEALFRYPVKSAGGEAVDAVELGWHGLAGDRRLAFRRLDDRGGFPWLTATKLAELLRFTPVRHDGDDPDGLPTHVRTPEGDELPVFAPELDADVGRRHGSPVELTHLDRGIFDEASVSAITAGTVAEVTRLAGHAADVRRFRPNILIAAADPAPFVEDAWVGGTLTFGDAATGPVLAITNWDQRCSMVSIDPDTADKAPEVHRAVVRERDNKAGVYGAVVRRGRLALGQPIVFTPGVDAAP